MIHGSGVAARPRTHPSPLEPAHVAVVPAGEDARRDAIDEPASHHIASKRRHISLRANLEGCAGLSQMLSVLDAARVGVHEVNA